MNKLINLNDPIDKQIIFAVVNEETDHIQVQGNYVYFPDADMLRAYRFGKKNVIWLNELSNGNCKKCNGSGKVGLKHLPVVKTVNEIATILREHLGKDSEVLPNILIEELKLPENFAEPLDMLIQIAVDDLSDDNLDIVSVKYAKMIRKDFKLTEQLFCPKCFLPNYVKAVEETRRAIKFGIN